MIDTQILAGLQNGTAFFASTSIFAIGGCFALLGATDRVDIIFRELPLVDYSGRAAFELKVAGLTAMFAYAFFKFGWAYRLFNYCTILFGALPLTADVAADRPRAEQAAEKVIRMNIIDRLSRLVRRALYIHGLDTVCGLRSDAPSILLRCPACSDGHRQNRMKSPK
jgi:uncharacterized membrane protein